MVKIALNDFLAVLIGYFLFVNVFLVFLIFAALVKTWVIRRRFPLRGSLKAHHYAYEWPAISIVAPAHNEEKSIVASVRSLLALNYPRFEVIVVNDGSIDATAEKLVAAFQMVEDETFEVAGVKIIADAQVSGRFRSRVNPNLYLVNKKQGGKAEALNVGICYARHELFCAIDSDSLLEPDALCNMVIPFIEKPNVVASGGTVRVVNGSVIRGSRVEKVKLPKNLLGLIQIVEYSRAFLFGRAGWSQMGANLLISGAFGIFKKSAVIAVGGYDTESIGEDMELVVRLHAHHRSLGLPYSVEFSPDPVCWTEVPTTIRGLYRQRHRWQRGLADSLLRQKKMFFNPRFGLIGLIGMPYQVFVELLGPVTEIVGFAALIADYSLGYLNFDLAVLFLMSSLLYSSTASLLAVLVERYYFSRNWTLLHLLVLSAAAQIESFGYRQVISIWRFVGMISFLFGDKSWGAMTRTGLTDTLEVHAVSLRAPVVEDSYTVPAISPFAPQDHNPATKEIP